MYSNLTVNELAEAFLVYRDAYKILKKENEANEASLKTKMEEVQAELNKFCEEQNASSIKTPCGTVIRSVATKYYTTDWDSLYNYINAHQAPYLLEKSISQGAMRAFLNDHPGTLPVGMTTDRRYSVTVRRPAKKL